MLAYESLYVIYIVWLILESNYVGTAIVSNCRFNASWYFTLLVSNVCTYILVIRTLINSMISAVGTWVDNSIIAGLRYMRDWVRKWKTWESRLSALYILDWHAYAQIKDDNLKLNLALAWCVCVVGVCVCGGVCGEGVCVWWGVWWGGVCRGGGGGGGGICPVLAVAGREARFANGIRFACSWWRLIMGRLSRSFFRRKFPITNDQWCDYSNYSVSLVRSSSWTNNRIAGDLRRRDT